MSTTDAQKEARARNWKILQLRGMVATLDNFGIDEDIQVSAIKHIKELILILTEPFKHK